jgi:hypothetical protein
MIDSTAKAQELLRIRRRKTASRLISDLIMKHLQTTPEIVEKIRENPNISWILRLS